MLTWHHLTFCLLPLFYLPFYQVALGLSAPSSVWQWACFQLSRIFIRWYLTEISSTMTWQRYRPAFLIRCPRSHFCTYLWQRHNTPRRASFLFFFFFPFVFLSVSAFLGCHTLSSRCDWSIYTVNSVVSVFHWVFRLVSSFEIKTLCSPFLECRLQAQPQVAGYFHPSLLCRPLSKNNLTELPVGIFDSLSLLNFLYVLAKRKRRALAC